MRPRSHSSPRRHRPPRRPRSWPEPSPGRGRDESGGAVSLWVVLMVPVSAFAAVVAMAGPQRLAAESSMDEAAEDLATMAVAWRDGQGEPEDPVGSFFADCDGLSENQQEELKNRTTDRDAAQTSLDTNYPDPPGPPDPQDPGYQDYLNLRDALRDAQLVLDLVEDEHRRWREACELLYETVVADLGYLGVDINSLEGFYSAALLDDPSDKCRISARIEVRNAVHVALAADWQHAGWAAAQVWPDGTRVGAESIGRLARVVSSPQATAECHDPRGRNKLDVLDELGETVWLKDPGHPSRALVQSSPSRTAISG